MKDLLFKLFIATGVLVCLLISYSKASADVCYVTVEFTAACGPSGPHELTDTDCDGYFDYYNLPSYCTGGQVRMVQLARMCITLTKLMQMEME